MYVELLTGAVGGAIGALITESIKYCYDHRKRQLGLKKTQLCDLYAPLGFHLMLHESLVRGALDTVVSACENEVEISNDSKLESGTYNLIDIFCKRADSQKEIIFNLIKTQYQLFDKDDIKWVDILINDTFINQSVLNELEPGVSLSKSIETDLRKNQESLFWAHGKVKDKINFLRNEIY